MPVILFDQSEKSNNFNKKRKFNILVIDIDYSKA